MAQYSLFELVNLTGIQAATIRAWERRYKILAPHRTDTNRRYYDDDDLRHILNVATMYRNGEKISKIATLSASELEQKVKAKSTEYVDADTSIDGMIAAMIGINKNAVNEILLRSIINVGFEQTYTGLVFPFLMRVGVLWQTGNLNLGAEHFISNIFRNKLISAIDALISINSLDKKRVIMFLPEKEMHELSLLFYQYVILKMGCEVVYLGQSTPMDAVKQVADKWHTDAVVTGLMSGAALNRTDEYLQQLSSTFKSQKVLVAGLLADEAEKNHFDNVIPIKSIDDLKFHLA